MAGLDLQALLFDVALLVARALCALTTAPTAPAHAPPEQLLEVELAEVLGGPEDGAHGHEEEGGVRVADEHDEHEEVAHLAEGDEARRVHAGAGEEGGEGGHEDGGADAAEDVLDAHEPLLVRVHVLQLAALEEVAQLAVGAGGRLGIPGFGRFSICIWLGRF